MWSPRGRDSALATGRCRGRLYDQHRSSWAAAARCDLKATRPVACVVHRVPGYREHWMAPTDRTRTPADDGNTAKLAVASGVGAPPLTVWLGSAMYTFPVGRDVIVGRDRECDIRFQDIDPDDLTLISRVHAILRFDGAQWVVVDKSQNGVYVDGSRATLVPIRDRLSITLGSPRGPELTFRVAASATSSGPRNPRTREHGPNEPVGATPNTTVFRPVAPPPSTRSQSQPPVRPSGPPSHPSRPDLSRPSSDSRRVQTPPRTAGSRGTATVGRAKT